MAAEKHYSAKDYSSIIVSRFDPSSIQYLLQEIDNDKRYSTRSLAGVLHRERFASKVLCKDCNKICNDGPTSLLNGKPRKIICNDCKFVYYSS